MIVIPFSSRISACGHNMRSFSFWCWRRVSRYLLTSKLKPILMATILSAVRNRAMSQKRGLASSIGLVVFDILGGGESLAPEKWTRQPKLIAAISRGLVCKDWWT